MTAAVTEEEDQLDPIEDAWLEQDVEHVRHNQSADDLAVAGHQIESAVLASAVKYHAQHRVLLNGLRTVVFE